MKILLGFFLCGTLMLSAATQAVPDTVFKDQDVWKFERDQWSKKEATVSKGMSRAEVVQALGKWFSTKTRKDEPDVEILRFYRDTAGPATLERVAGQDSLHYFMHEDRIEVFIKSGVLVDVVVTRGRDREHHDAVPGKNPNPLNTAKGSWESSNGTMVDPVKFN